MTDDDRPTLADLAATPVPPLVEVDHLLVRCKSCGRISSPSHRGA